MEKISFFFKFIDCLKLENSPLIQSFIEEINFFANHVQLNANSANIVKQITDFLSKLHIFQTD